MKTVIKYLLFPTLMMPVMLFAQLDPVSLALRAYQGGDLNKAKELIDIAVNDDTYSTQSKTWYFRGYIYKDLYKQDRQSIDGRALREEAIKSYQKAVNLDSEKEFTEDTHKSLKYLASTLYNDAAIALDTNNFRDAQVFYEEYKSVMRFIDPGIDFRSRDIEFKLYKASKLSLLFENPEPGTNTEELGNEIIKLYEEVLALDSNNVSANYNLAIHYYNQGVHIIDNMDIELPFEELFAIQDKVTELFQKALPYMLKAYKLSPERKSILQGLSGIYYGLNDIEKSEYYQKLLEEIEQKENSGGNK
ncbi:MAG: hypothetical protein Kow0075_16900 [Salibacteraceae bacterium]